ncbi:hypothetical protein TVAG_045660 [Trichomonas vaginalis G3]|uniref:Uncharacterized protein n=1 Tax=Trichomonas vaginalis (strain ATCC PRA-98 / G3) TaxID=412133 RepID=A2DMD7_TRIV3|nr:hypothetical protein TVAGG3_0604790 [Trichomonas vaginalis G3]EAY18364.1 hypothetical protein TVAG_045660 [Trichomonas vaginalis G3]KAI5524171.1 hypothetical protein TVAGG3_0604790 [Trichomonas vaginalis G3]|eukprot:XP_001579350.1 hypothetical protein [Trichomonas vaginalis G3]
MRPLSIPDVFPKICLLITNQAIVEALNAKLKTVNASKEFKAKKPCFYHVQAGDKFPFMISFKKNGVIHVVADTFVYRNLKYGIYLGEVLLKFDIRTDLPFEEVLDRLTGYSTKDIDPKSITYFDPIIFKEGPEMQNFGYDEPINNYIGALNKMYKLEKASRLFHFAADINLKYNRINKLAALYEPQGNKHIYRLIQFDDPYILKMEGPKKEKKKVTVIDYLRSLPSKIYSYFAGYKNLQNTN